MGLFGAGNPPCPAGSICSGQSRTKVGAKLVKVQEVIPGTQGSTRTVEKSQGGTDIYHSSVTTLNSDGTATTDVYIIKDGSWQKAATTSDGGKTYTFDNNVAGAGLQNELSDPQGAIHKNVDANINKAVDKAGLPKQEKDKVVDGNSNKTEPTNSESNAGTQDSPQAPKSPDVVAAERTEYENLRYPTDLAETDQDFLKIMMVKYEPRGLSFNKGGGLESRATLGSELNNVSVGDRTILSNIVLPIPAGISDSNRVGWGDDTMDPLQAAGADLAGTFMMGGDAEKVVKDIAGSVQNDPGGAQQAVAGKMTQAITGVNRLAREQGAVINNNLELLFQQAELRNFTFQFKFSARSSGEALEIKKIIRTLKQGMSPKRANNRLFLKAPHTFFLGYYKGNKLHPYLNKFKECALVGLSVQYAPDGNYATYTDGSMTSYQVNMEFKELEPIFDDEYGGGYDNIGY